MVKIKLNLRHWKNGKKKTAWRDAAQLSVPCEKTNVLEVATQTKNKAFDRQRCISFLWLFYGPNSEAAVEVNRVKRKLFVSKDEISIKCQFLVFRAEIGQKIITIKSVLLGNYWIFFSLSNLFLLICFALFLLTNLNHFLQH